jgi:serine/threonine-protein kinase ATR
MTSQGSSVKENDTLSTFIEEHALGIITEFARAVNDFQIRQSVVEKKRTVIGIGEMLKIANGNISVALPQICACLRSALETDELRDHAFASWDILITSLAAPDVGPLIDQTLAIILRYWKKFRRNSRETALQLVKHIFIAHENLVEETFQTMPSLSSVPEMAAFDSVLTQWKLQMDTRARFAAYCQRCQNENSVVVQQALQELLQDLTKHEEFIHGSAINEQPDQNLVALLSRSLLDCCAKFNSSSPVIRSLAAECLGLVGCLDPNRIESVKDKKDILVLSNFDRTDEIFDFVLFFLQNVLVEAFHSTSNTRTQGFLSYAMQALLSFCKLDSAVPPRPQDIDAAEIYRRWLSVPESVRNTLTPFLSSKYTVTVGAISTTCNYPLFSKDLSHSEWLRTFVLDMLQKGKSPNTKVIFSVSSRIIRNQDISIASFLLPFAALNIAVSDEEPHRMTLAEELVNVLKSPLPEHDHQAREETILCSEVSSAPSMPYGRQ